MGFNWLSKHPFIGFKIYRQQKHRGLIESESLQWARAFSRVKNDRDNFYQGTIFWLLKVVIRNSCCRYKKYLHNIVSVCVCALKGSRRIPAVWVFKSPFKIANSWHLMALALHFGLVVPNKHILYRMVGKGVLNIRAVYIIRLIKRGLI